MRSTPQPGIALRARIRPIGTPLAILVLLGLLLAAALVATPPPEPIPYDLDGSHPAGLLGLRLWLEELGYDVRRTEGLQFHLPADADLIFVYPNQLTYTKEEADALHDWVSSGGTLVLVGPSAEDGQLVEAFGVETASDLYLGRSQPQVQPLLPEGRAVYSREWFAPGVTLDLGDAPQAAPVLALSDDQNTEGDVRPARSRAVVAVQGIGKGVVWHLAPGADLTNLNLQEYDQGELLPALLRSVSANGVVVFDTYHLFGFSRVGEQIGTLQDWLYRTPTGWATLFTLAVSAVFLLLQGRRLGPPLITVEQTRGREAAEYVRAMAQLHRRAREHAELARHHHSRLKVGLARRRGVRSDLSDEAFLDALQHTAPRLTDEQSGAIRTTLVGLANRPNEEQLVNLAATVDNLLQSIS